MVKSPLYILTGGFSVKIKINPAKQRMNRIGSLENTRAMPPGCAAAGWEWKSTKSVEWTLFFLKVRNASSACPSPNPDALSYKNNLVVLIQAFIPYLLTSGSSAFHSFKDFVSSVCLCLIQVRLLKKKKKGKYVYEHTCLYFKVTLENAQWTQLEKLPKEGDE